MNAFGPQKRFIPLETEAGSDSLPLPMALITCKMPIASVLVLSRLALCGWVVNSFTFLSFFVSKMTN